MSQTFCHILVWFRLLCFYSIETLVGYLMPNHVFLTFTYFLFLLLRTFPPQISLFLIESKPPVLVKSLMKLNTLDATQLWPSAQRDIVKINNPYHHHTNLYLFLSLSFFFCLFRLFPYFIFLYFYHYFIYFLNCWTLEELIFILMKFCFQ